MNNYIILLISMALGAATMQSAYKGSKKYLAITGGSCIAWFMLLIIL